MFESFTLYGAAAMLAVLVALAATGLLLGQSRRRGVVAGERTQAIDKLVASLDAYVRLLHEPPVAGAWGDDDAERLRGRFDECRQLQKATLPELGAETVAVLATQGRLLDHLWRRRLQALRRPDSTAAGTEDAQFQELLQLHLDSLQQLLARCESVASVAGRGEQVPAPSLEPGAAVRAAALSDVRG